MNSGRPVIGRYSWSRDRLFNKASAAWYRTVSGSEYQSRGGEGQGRKGGWARSTPGYHCRNGGQTKELSAGAARPSPSQGLFPRPPVDGPGGGRGVVRGGGLLGDMRWQPRVGLGVCREGGHTGVTTCGQRATTICSRQS